MLSNPIENLFFTFEDEIQKEKIIEAKRSNLAFNTKVSSIDDIKQSTIIPTSVIDEIVKPVKKQTVKINKEKELTKEEYDDKFKFLEELLEEYEFYNNKTNLSERQQNIKNDIENKIQKLSKLLKIDTEKDDIEEIEDEFNDEDIEEIEEIEDEFNDEEIEEIEDEFNDDNNEKKEVKKNIIDEITDIFTENIEPEQLEIEYEGPFFDAGGYARMNREFVRNLTKLGCLVKPTIMQPRNNMAVVDIKDIINFEKLIIDNCKIKIYGMLLPQFLADINKYKIGFTMMESSTLGPNYIERCKHADELFVPSNFNKSLFSNAGFDKPITVIPLGVDPDLYNPNTTNISEKINPDNKFMFLSIFGFSKRKGYDALLTAYFEEFSKQDDVMLLICSRYWNSTDKYNCEKIRNIILEYRSKINPNNAASVAYQGDFILEEDLPKYYKTANCFVLPSRGEGWGLPYAEAGAVGIPVIATKHGGQLDFLNDNNSYLVEFNEYENADKDMAINISSYYEGQKFPKLDRNFIDRLRKNMREVYENYDEALNKSTILRKDIHEKYTWENCAKIMLNRLYEINNEIGG